MPAFVGPGEVAHEGFGGGPEDLNLYTWDHGKGWGQVHSNVPPLAVFLFFMAALFLKLFHHSTPYLHLHPPTSPHFHYVGFEGKSLSKEPWQGSCWALVPEYAFGSVGWGGAPNPHPFASWDLVPFPHCGPTGLGLWVPLGLSKHCP